MTSWDTSDIVGPDGEDWRVPVTELAARQTRLADMLAEAQVPGALIQHPVDLYYYGGGRQDGSLFIPAKGAGGSVEAGGDGPVAFVRRSFKRAVWEAGGDDAPHLVKAFPRLSTFAETLRGMGVNGAPALQFGEAPGSFTARFASRFLHWVSAVMRPASFIANGKSNPTGKLNRWTLEPRSK